MIHRLENFSAEPDLLNVLETKKTHRKMNPPNAFESYEEPLRGGIPYYYKTEWKKSRVFQGPKRAIRLCILCIVLPGLLIGVPLYLK